MKTKKILTLVIGLFGVIFISSCGIRWNSSTVAGETICSNYTDGISELPVQLIHKMTDGYKDNQLYTINRDTERSNPFSPVLTGSDARAIKFDLITLKKFVYYLEREAKANDNTISDKDLGIRIYYASYPNEDEMNTNNELKKTVPANFANRHTLVMVPTIWNNKTKSDLDFNPKDPNTFENGLTKEYGRNGSRSIPALQLNTWNRSGAGSSGTSAQNHGSLYPPLGNNGMTF